MFSFFRQKSTNTAEVNEQTTEATYFTNEVNPSLAKTAVEVQWIHFFSDIDHG